MSVAVELKNVKIVADNVFFGSEGLLLKDENGRVEVAVKSSMGLEFTYAGESADIEVIE